MWSGESESWAYDFGRTKPWDLLKTSRAIRTLHFSAVAIVENRTEYITNDRADVILIMLKSYCVDTTVVLCGAVALVQRVPFSAFLLYFSRELKVSIKSEEECFSE